MGATVSVANATLIVTGDLLIVGMLGVAQDATVQVSGSIVLLGSLNVTRGARIIAGRDFVVAPTGATLTPVFSASPTIEGSVTFAVVSFASHTGPAPSAQPVIATFPGAQCVEFGPPSLDLTSTSLSATVSVAQKCRTSSVIPKGAIVGVVVAIIVAVLAGLVVLTVFLVKRRAGQPRPSSFAPVTGKPSSSAHDFDHEDIFLPETRRMSIRANPYAEHKSPYVTNPVFGIAEGDRSSRRVPLLRNDGDVTSGVISPRGLTRGVRSEDFDL